MKTKIFIFVMTLISVFPMKGWAATVGQVETGSTEVVLASAPAKTSTDHEVYLVNPGPNVLEVEVVGGRGQGKFKKKPCRWTKEDLVTKEGTKKEGYENYEISPARFVSSFGYRDFEAASLKIRVCSPKGGIVREIPTEIFQEGAWVVLFDEKGEFERTRDLNKLPERKRKG